MRLTKLVKLQERSTQTLVVLVAALTLIDSFATWYVVTGSGLQAEANPLIRYFFQEELGYVWLIGNLILTCVAVVLLGGLFERSDPLERQYFAIALSLLFALKLLSALSHVNSVYQTNSIWLVSILFTIGLFFMVDRSLITGRFPDALTLPREILSNFSYVAKRLMTLELRTSSSIASIGSPPHRGKRQQWSKGRMVMWIVVASAAPVVLLIFLEFLMRLSGVSALPRWMRSLGVVTAVQGQIMIVALASIILTLAIMVYAISSLFNSD
jgi:hypothetical protein